MPKPDTPELDAKLDYLFELDGYASKVFRHLNQTQHPPRTKSDLARLCGVNHNNFSPNDGRLSEPNCTRIARLYGFDGTDGADCRQSFQHGSFQAFMEDFEALHGDLGRTMPKPSRRARDTSQMLAPGPERDLERSKIDGLASVSLVCGNTERGQTNIGAVVNCGDAAIPDSAHRMTIAAAVLEINCGDARAELDSIKGTKPGERRRFRKKGTDSEVVWTWSGDVQFLRWTLDALPSSDPNAEPASIGTVRYDDEMLARVVSLAPGDEIKGSLGAFLKDISSAPNSTEVPTEAVSIIDRFGEPAKLEAKALSELQLRAMEHLRKSALGEIDDQGFAVLARHSLQFIKRDDT